MTAIQEWTEFAKQASLQEAELFRIESDLKLQVRKIETARANLREMKKYCLQEAEKETISLEEVIHDTQVEAQREETERGN